VPRHGHVPSDRLWSRALPQLSLQGPRPAPPVLSYSSPRRCSLCSAGSAPVSRALGPAGAPRSGLRGPFLAHCVRCEPAPAPALAGAPAMAVPRCRSSARLGMGLPGGRRGPALSRSCAVAPSTGPSELTGCSSPRSTPTQQGSAGARALPWAFRGAPGPNSIPSRAVKTVAAALRLRRGPDRYTGRYGQFCEGKVQ
jgi:hypothetical protein